MKAILAIIVAIPLLTQAQEEFSFQLFFEDSMGNRDTIIIGYDELATDSIDTILGEVNILTQNWDSVFEVRCSVPIYSGMFNPTDLDWLAKKSINPYDSMLIQGNYVNSFHTHGILVKCKNFPLKLSWNNNIIDMAGLKSSYFSYPQILDYSEHLMDYDSLLFLESDFRLQFLTNYDSIIPFNFNFSDTLLSLGINQDDITHLNIRPNPSNGEFWIKLNEQVQKGEIIITDLTGKQIAKVSVSNTTNVSLSNMSEGVYLINLVSENTIIDTQKIVIQR